MLATYLNITIIAEWCAFIAAIFLLNKRTGVWQLFILLLLVTIYVEAQGWYLSYELKKYNNSFPFNVLMISSIGFFILFFGTADHLKKYKRLLQLGFMFFVLCALYNILFFQGFWQYNSYTEALGDLIVSMICFYFLFTILKDETYINPFHDEYFWLANGLLFSSLGSALLYLFLSALQQYYLKTGTDVYGSINRIINITLYGSLIIAFVCRRTTK